MAGFAPGGKRYVAHTALTPTERSFDGLIRNPDAVTVTVRLTSEEEARLDALSRRTGRTKSFYVRAAIRAHLEELEDLYAADEAMKDFEATGRKSRPITALAAELGLTESDIAEGRALNASAEHDSETDPGLPA